MGNDRRIAMRVAVLTTAAMLAWGAMSPTRADPGSFSATIVLPEVEVRSGPSMEYYATSKLRYGEAVRVLRQEDGWYAIAPPAPGSFSWVDAKHVDRTGASATVKVPEAQLRVGSQFKNDEPTVTRTRVTKGTQLTVIGNPTVASDGTWLPVLPAPLEVRYIPLNAIGAGNHLGETPPPPLAASTSSNSAPPARPVPTVVGTNPLITEAERAEQHGNYGKAIELYEELAKQLLVSDHTLAVRCLNRAEYLRDMHRRGTPIVQQPPARPTEAYYPNNTNGQAAPAPYYSCVPTSYPCAQPVPSASQYCYQAEPPHTVRLVPPTTAAPTAPSQAVSATSPAGQWYGPYRLRRAPFDDERNKRVYAAENDNGQLWMYVTAGDGIDLAPYLSRAAYLFGNVTYHGVLRNNYMVITQIRALP
jgi:hypothetical protein